MTVHDFYLELNPYRRMERDGSEGRGRESRGRPGGNRIDDYVGHCGCGGPVETLCISPDLKSVSAGGSRMKGKKNGGVGGGLVGGFWK